MVGFHADRLDVIVDNSPQGRCPDRGYSDKRLTSDVLRANGAPCSQSVVARHQDDQRILSQRLEFQTARLLLRAQKRQVDFPSNETGCEIRRILAMNDDFGVGKFGVQDFHHSRQPIHLVAGEEADRKRSPRRLRGSLYSDGEELSVPIQPVERKLAAIFAADIAGYSRLMARDEVDTLARLKACRAIIDQLIEAHRGRIFNTAGDSVVG